MTQVLGNGNTVMQIQLRYKKSLAIAAISQVIYLFFLMVVNDAFAGRLEIINGNSDETISNSNLNIIRSTSAKENYDAYDFPVTPWPGGPLLEIYTMVSEQQLALDARPRSSITPIEFYLSVKETITSTDNYLRFQVLNTTGFEHRIIRVQQISPTVGDEYVIPKDGSVFTINLPNLNNPPEGVYAVWQLTFDRILEGDINEDGVVDLLDLEAFVSEWLNESSETENGGNYLISDTDLNRITDFYDFAILAESWMESE